MIRKSQHKPLLSRATANGQVFEDTKQRGKPIVFTYGTRPFTGGMCKGTEEALATMKAGECPEVMHARRAMHATHAMSAGARALSNQGSARCLACEAVWPSPSATGSAGEDADHLQGACKVAAFAAGGVRKVIVPPELGFGESGYVLRPTEHVPEKQGVVPPGATLEYELSVLRVSIPPS